MKRVTTHEAKTHLSALLKEARNGEEIVILKGTEPVAKLTPVAGGGERRPRVGAITSGEIVATPDAFAPLSDDELVEWGL